MSNFDYAAIVLGSGFGGAITACRLAQAGYDVLILERGRRWQGFVGEQRPDATFYPRELGDPWIFDDRHPERRSGWLDVRRFATVGPFEAMWVVVAAGVGGGSLLFSNVVVEAARETFDQGWPEEIDADTLQPYFAKVGRMLDLTTIPGSLPDDARTDQLTKRFKLVRRAAEKLGKLDDFQPLPLAVNFDPQLAHHDVVGKDPQVAAAFTRLAPNSHGVEQGTCVHLGNCNIGCDVKARNILDVNYIPEAERAGAEVRALHLARKIAPHDGGYRVDYDRIDIDSRRRSRGHASARIVVIACGSLGSTELLLRCRDQYRTLPQISEHLGRGWSANGDFMLGSIHDRAVHMSHGPTISAAVDWIENPVGKEKLFVQDGGFPNTLPYWLGRLRVAQARDKIADKVLEHLTEDLGEGDEEKETFLSRVMPWFGVSQDAGDGVLKLSKIRKRLELDWKTERSEETIETLIRTQCDMARAAGGRPVVSPTWTLFKLLATAHPLGGCNMGDPPGRGKAWVDHHGRERRTDHAVVDHRGEVFGHRNLFVADGSIVPRPLGRNPSRTIAALAERIAEIIVEERR